MSSFARLVRGGVLGLALLALASPVAAQVAEATPSPSPLPPSLDIVLARARAAVGQYLNQAALLLADERCEQTAVETVNGSGAIRGVPQPRQRRRWQAEIAVVPTPELASSGYPWAEFRDVLVVDGRAVPDREQRLSTILRKQNTLRIDQARAMARESARFNIGRERNTNTPSVPLLVLAQSNANRFTFSSAGEERIERVTVLKVQFRELRSPTLIRAGEADCFAAGSLWIAAETGDVVRAEIRCGDDQRATPPMTVRYGKDARLGLWLPLEMDERAFDGPVGIGVTSVDAKCRYSNYRRFETGAKLILK